MRSRSRRLYLPALAFLSILLYIAASALTYRMGFPLDDAWIHQTYARNLAQLHEWSFIPGQPSAGSTSPLWSLFLSLGYFLRLNPFLWSAFLGWLFLWMIGYFGLRIFVHVTPDLQRWAWAVAGILLLEWHLVWAALSGMETTLFSWVTLLLFWGLLQIEKKWLLLGGLIGVSIWVRPDGLTLLGPALFVVFAQKSSSRQRISDMIWLVIGFLSAFLPYLAWNKALSGAWWPNTFYAKQAEYAVELQAPLLSRIFEQAMLPNIGVGVLLLPGFIFTFIQAIQRRQWVVLSACLWCSGYLVLYALRLPVTYQHGRYVIPMMPVFFILGLVGILRWLQPRSITLWKRALSKAWGVSIGLVCLVFWLLGAHAYARDVAFIESEMVAAAQWIAENTEADDLIAVHDIGALGYFGQRDLLDLAGLVSPEVIPFIRDEEKLLDWISARNADYLVTFPTWYPIMTRDLNSIWSTGGTFSQAFDGENMVVYGLNLRLR